MHARWRGCVVVGGACAGTCGVRGCVFLCMRGGVFARVGVRWLVVRACGDWLRAWLRVFLHKLWRGARRGCAQHVVARVRRLTAWVCGGCVVARVRLYVAFVLISHRLCT
jgi:hypothetical protein